MTADHDLRKDPARSMRELTIRLLVETDPEQEEALIAQLAEIVKVQRGSTEGCLVHLPGA
jgi:hypothetical protein